MALKHARLARAENLSPEIRQQFNLPERGLIVIESRNPDLKEHFAVATDITSYLIKSHGEFKEVEIEED